MFRRKSATTSRQRPAEDDYQKTVRFNPEMLNGLDYPKRFTSRRRKSRVAVQIHGV